MRVYRGFDDIARFETGAVATVGSFDGIHSGHAVLLDELKQISERDSIPSIVFTFEPHPRIVLGRTDGLKLLTSLEEKIVVLERMGIDCLIVIPFDREFSRVAYNDFIANYLVGLVGVSQIVVGYNHQMGRDSEGSYSSLVKLGAEIGLEVTRVAEWRAESVDVSISSTVVRNMLLRGEVTKATALLNRPYLICGRTDDGGRVWYDEPLKLIPSEGRYKAVVNGSEAEIEIDNNGVVTSAEINDHVVIEMSSDALKN